MHVIVKYFAMVRDLTGQRTEVISLPENADISQLFSLLIRKYGEKMAYYIFDENGGLRDYLSYMLNGVNIHSLDGLRTKISEGDTFSLLPPIGGGMRRIM